MPPSLQDTIGALLAGAMFSAACVLRASTGTALCLPQLIGFPSFSGVLAVQIFFYHRMYPKDHRLYKVMVGDVIHPYRDHNDLITSHQVAWFW
jgi:hypothetical protein